MLRIPLLCGAVLAALVMAHPGVARDCVRPETAPGVRGPVAVGCKAPTARQDSKTNSVRAGRTPGFIDLGNGAELRISGGVEAEGQFRTQRR